MKNVYFVILCMVTLALTACGGGGGSSTQAASPAQTTGQTQQTPTPISTDPVPVVQTQTPTPTPTSADPSGAEAATAKELGLPDTFTLASHIRDGIAKMPEPVRPAATQLAVTIAGGEVEYGTDTTSAEQLIKPFLKALTCLQNADPDDDHYMANIKAVEQFIKDADPKHDPQELFSWLLDGAAGLYLTDDEAAHACIVSGQ